MWVTVVIGNSIALFEKLEVVFELYTSIKISSQKAIYLG